MALFLIIFIGSQVPTLPTLITMAADHASSKTTQWKYPVHITSTAVIGDSQIKYVHQNFDPHRRDAPAFICQSGAGIRDLWSLMDFVPRTVTTLVLHIGTNDLSCVGADTAFGKYREFLRFLFSERPEIRTVHATLVLPRMVNRRRGRPNWPAVRRFNAEAYRFNGLLRQHCRRTRSLYFVDHEFEHLPPGRVLAADGLHPSFGGVALIAGRLQHVLLRGRKWSPLNWCDHAATGTDITGAGDQTTGPLASEPQSDRGAGPTPEGQQESQITYSRGETSRTPTTGHHTVAMTPTNSESATTVFPVPMTPVRPPRRGNSTAKRPIERSYELRSSSAAVADAQV